MLLLKTAWLNVIRNWWHGISAMAMKALCFCAISMIFGFVSESSKTYFDFFSKNLMLGQYIIQKKGADHYYAEDPLRYGLNKKEQVKIDSFLVKNEKTFFGSVRFLQLSGLLSSGKTTTLMAGYGYDVENGLKMRGETFATNTTFGKPLRENLGSAIVVGSTLGRILGCYEKSNRGGDLQCSSSEVMLSTTTLTGQMNASYFKISGVLEEGFREVDDKFIALPLIDAQRLLDTENISMYSIDGTPDFEKQLKLFLAQQLTDVQVKKWTEHPIGGLYNRGMGLLNVFTLFVIVIISIVCGLTVGNTMLRRVQERVREIGTMRSLGFSKNHVLSLFLVESVILSLIGSSVGLFLSLILSFAINNAHIQYNPGFLSSTTQLFIRTSPLHLFISFIFIMLISLIATWICTTRTTRLNIADALRSI